MAPIPEERRDWLPELAISLTAIAMALAGQEPTPERLAEIGAVFADAVADHPVELHWFPRGYLNEPEIDEPGEPEYGITISGDRILAGWLIPATELPRLLALSSSI